MFSSQTIISGRKSDSPFLNEDFKYPTGIAVDSEGSVIFVDTMTAKIIKFNQENEKTVTIAGSGNSGFQDGKGLSAEFNFPVDVAIDKDDVIYVGDSSNMAIRKISNDNVVTTIISGVKVSLVQAIAYYEAEKTIFYVSKTFVGRVQNDGSGYKLWAGSSQTGYQDGKGANARFTYAMGISVNQMTGEVFVSELHSQAVRKIDRNQDVVTVIKGLSYPRGLHVIRNDSIIITEYWGNRIKRYSFETQNITVIAGNGNPGLFDGVGKDANMCQPAYVTWNPLRDEIIFSEWGNGIRVINKFNFVSTALMPFGFGLEDGVASKSRISTFTSITLDDKEETLYFVDLFSNSLRKASVLDGYVVTLGGKPYSGDVIGNLSDALFSNPSGIAYFNESLLITDYENSMIKKVSLDTSTVENFLVFERPHFVSIDQAKSSFYILYNYLGAPISKYGINGNPIHRLAGTGLRGCEDGYYHKAKVESVKGIYTMANGDSYFTDNDCNTLRYFDSKTLNISTIAGKSYISGTTDGTGEQALFGRIYSLDYYSAEDLFYISDQKLNAVRQVTLTGNVSTLTGSIEGGYRNGPMGIALFQNPTDIKALSNGDIIVCDDGNYAVRIIRKKEGKVETLFGYGSQKYHQNPGGNVELNFPISITGKDRLIYVLNREDNNIVGYDLKEQKRFLLAGNGAIGWNDGESILAMFNRPEEIHYSEKFDCIFVADTRNHLIRKVTMQGVVSTFAGNGQIGSSSNVLLASNFNRPSSITTDSSGNMFVADSGNNIIRKIGNGKVSIHAGSLGSSSNLVDGKLMSAKFSNPSGIDYNGVTGCLIVADMYNHAIRSINATHVSTLAGNGSSGNLDGPYSLASFAYPRKITVDEDGVIYITESYSNRVRVLSRETVSTILTKLKSPMGLHATNGVLYVSEFRDNAIKSILLKTSTSIPTPSLDSVVSNYIVIAVVIGMTAIGLAVFLIISRRLKLKNQGLVTKKLKQIQSNNLNLAHSNEKTGTVTLKQPLALAVPGYLELNLSESVKVAEFGGKGGTAKVILGTLSDSKLIEKHGFLNVAIKFPNEDANIEEFLYEITIMNTFPKSDNIVEIVGYSSNPLTIVMKSYPTTLSEFLSAANDGQDLKTRVSFARDIAKGMEIIHNYGVIHFDLKPANILLHYVGKALTAVVCDFGFANFTSDAQANLVKGVKAPRTNGITARYAAPEQFQHIESVNFRENRLEDEIFKKVDVFSYGMTIYYVFSGYKPWENVDQVEAIEKLVCTGQRPEIKVDISSDLADLMKRCWSHAAQDRPSFSNIIKDLNNLDSEK